MRNLQEAVNLVTQEVAKKAIRLEDSAVAQYIKSQADYLVAQGKDLTKYDLVRDIGNYEIEGSAAIGKVKYGLIERSKVKDIRDEPI